MESLGKDFVSTLIFLLPGFITAWVFYAFTSYPRPSQFERVVQALIYTILVQSLVVIEEQILLSVGKHWLLGIWNGQAALLCATTTALVLGILMSYLANHDYVHSLARKLRITRETSYATPWFRAFNARLNYVVLTLKDERRLYGWPLEWPSDPSRGHFVLERVSWLHGKRESKATELDNVDAFVLDVNEVKWVEFVKGGHEQ